MISNIEISELINKNENYIFVFLILSFIFIIYFIKRLTIKNKNLRLKIKNLVLFDFFIWSLQFLQIFLIIEILNVGITIFDTIVIFGISILVGLLPISIGGFGVRDYVIFLLFSNLGIDGNLFLILLLFNLRYILPIILSFFFSFFNLFKIKKLKF